MGHGIISLSDTLLYGVKGPLVGIGDMVMIRHLWHIAQKDEWKEERKEGRNGWKEEASKQASKQGLLGNSKYIYTQWVSHNLVFDLFH